MPPPYRDANMENPLVHPIYSDTTNTWQYVVASSTTKRCLVLDPVRDCLADKSQLTTAAADALLFLIRQCGYTVDFILETHASQSRCLSAAWYVRMQLSSTQAQPPQLCTDAGVPGLDAMWQRKYGKGMSTTIRPGLEDGAQVVLGGLAVICTRIPTNAPLDTCIYQIDKELFGAYALVTTTHGQNDPREVLHDIEFNPSSDARSRMQRILSLPGETRIWHTEACSSSASDSYPCKYLLQCLSSSTAVNLSQAESRRSPSRPLQSSEESIPSAHRDSGGGERRFGAWRAGLSWRT